MIRFKCDSERFQDFFNRALQGLANNCRQIRPDTNTVLIEGGEYSGVWLECAPLEGLIYAAISPEIAKNNHTIFYKYQRMDGQLPYTVKANRIGFSQIQQVVPLAETAYELGVITQDEEFLHLTYQAWRKWDQWISCHRDKLKRNVCEAFCEYDTGHDKSFRFKGLPKFCPDDEAAICPEDLRLPYVAPDLTATMFGGRIAMAKIATALGYEHESNEWLERAEIMRQSLFKYCFDSESEFFYDLDNCGNFVKNLSDAGIRVLGEHAVSQELFDRIFNRWISNPDAFWTPYPIPSVAACDPGFEYPPPENCWGGASQALLALRSWRWLEYYGKFNALNHLMSCWLNGMQQNSDFMQQMDPFTGKFSTSSNYSPAMCCGIDFTSRMAGVCETPEGLNWGGAGIPEVSESFFELECLRGGSAGIRIKNKKATLILNGVKFVEIKGRFRAFCDSDGKNLRITALENGNFEVAFPGRLNRFFQLKADQSQNLN